MKGRICERCGIRPAEVIYVEVVEGKKRVMHLCHICAEQEANGLKHIYLPHEVKAPVQVVPQCPYCGHKLEELKTTLKLGCPKCYEVFEGVVKDILKKLNWDLDYKGELREDKDEHKKELVLLKIHLKKELKEAIKEENYERAAKIRDSIKEINRKLGANELV